MQNTINNKNKGRFTSKMDQYKKMKCPRCSTLLNRKIMKKIEHPSGAVLDVCENCGGMWVDYDEVKMLYNFSNKKSKKNVKGMKK